MRDCFRLSAVVIPHWRLPQIVQDCLRLIRLLQLLCDCNCVSASPTQPTSHRNLAIRQPVAPRIVCGWHLALSRAIAPDCLGLPEIVWDCLGLQSNLIRRQLRAIANNRKADMPIPCNRGQRIDAASLSRSLRCFTLCSQIFMLVQPIVQAVLSE